MEKLRERAAELFARGVSQADVARELDVSRQSVSRSQASFRHGGAAALRGAGRAGRKTRPSSTSARVEKQL
jgi:transposase